MKKGIDGAFVGAAEILMGLAVVGSFWVGAIWIIVKIVKWAWGA